MMLQLAVLAVIAACLVDMSLGNGLLTNPPMRSTLWRLGYNTPINYNDHTLNCGGFERQHKVNGGKCGVCGDPWDGVRENEAKGLFASGTIITRQYTTGSDVTMTVEMLAPRGGYFELRLCPVADPNVPVTQECLDRHPLEILNGQGTRYPVMGELKEHHGIYDLTVRLPVGVTCSHCVIQWKYHAANDWGYDSDGRLCKGCGPQFEQYNCADVAILPGSGSGTIVSGDASAGTIPMIETSAGEEAKPTIPVHQDTTHVMPGPGDSNTGGGDNSAVQGSDGSPHPSPNPNPTNISPGLQRDPFETPVEDWLAHPGTNSGGTDPSPTPYLSMDSPSSPPQVPSVTDTNPSPTPYDSSSGGTPSDTSGRSNPGGSTDTYSSYGAPTPTTDPGATGPEIPDGSKTLIPDAFFDDHVPEEDPNQETVFNELQGARPIETSNPSSTTTVQSGNDQAFGDSPSEPTTPTGTTGYTSTVPDPDLDFGGDTSLVTDPDPGFGGYTNPVADPDPSFGGDTSPVNDPDQGFGGESIPVTDPDQGFGGDTNPVTDPNQGFGGDTSPVTDPDQGFGEDWDNPNDVGGDFPAVDADPTQFTHTDNEGDVSAVTDSLETSRGSGSKSRSSASSGASDATTTKSKKSKKKSKKPKVPWGPWGGHRLMDQLYHLNLARHLANQVWGGHANMVGAGNWMGNQWGGHGGAWGVGMWPASTWGVFGANGGNWGAAGQMVGNSWGNAPNQNAWSVGNAVNSGVNSGWSGSGNSWGNNRNSWNGQQRPLAAHLPRCDSSQRLVCQGLGNFANDLQTRQYCNQDCRSGGNCPTNVCSCQCKYQQSLDCKYKTSGFALPSNHEWCNNLCNSGSCPAQFCDCNTVVNW